MLIAVLFCPSSASIPSNLRGNKVICRQVSLSSFYKIH